MDSNGSTLASDSQLKIATILNTNLTLLTLITGLIAIVLNRWYHCHHKDKYQIDPMERIFLFMLTTCCMLECFNWFVLLNNFVGCTVLGAVREYIIISSLVIFTCLGTQLLILTTQPKCLQVIKEEKLKRYKIIVYIYLTVSLLVPILFIPWPFISVQYGRGEYYCWLRDDVSYFISRFLMWYIWAFLVWLFTVGVLVLVLYKYCVHRGISSTKWKLDVNIGPMISILTAFVVVGAIVVILQLINNYSSFIQDILITVLTSIVWMILLIIVIIRQVIIIKIGQRKIRMNTHMSVVTQGGREYTAPSSTYFTFPRDE